MFCIVWLKQAFFLTLCVLIENQSRLSDSVLGSKPHSQMVASLQEVTTKQANSYISSKAWPTPQSLFEVCAALL